MTLAERLHDVSLMVGVSKIIQKECEFSDYLSTGFVVRQRRYIYLRVIDSKNISVTIPIVVSKLDR